MEVTEGVGQTGVVGVLKNGSGPTVMIRTDLDALPVTEATGLAYASKVKVKGEAGETGVMHACGHDIHITSLIGTARWFAANKDQWQGTLIFLGQPAEERVGGAKRDARRRAVHAVSQARLLHGPALRFAARPRARSASAAATCWPTSIASISR